MDAELKLYLGAVEWGTLGNPIAFGSVVAGTAYEHPSNPFYLWNDKGGILGSVPARSIGIQMLNMWIEEELIGTSNGTAYQEFTASVIPIIDDATAVKNSVLKVGTYDWDRVVSLATYAPDATVYTLDVTTGVIAFGDGVHGAIPANGENIYFTYMPDLLAYGDEVYMNTWLEVRSFGVTSYVVTEIDEQQISQDASNVVIANPMITAVSGVWLQTDPTHAGTNYYTGGSFAATTGVITLGTPLPGANTPVLIDYSCRPIDDLEAEYTPIGMDATHTLANILQNNNAKLLYFRLNVPVDATPSGGGQVNFRIRVTYRQ